VSPFHVVVNPDAFTLSKISENAGMGANTPPKCSVNLSVRGWRTRFPAGIFKF